MRSPLSWFDLTALRGVACTPGRAGTRVGIYGLGTEGRASLRACVARGIDPVLVDDTPSGCSDLEPDVVATGDGGLDELLSCDVVIKSPGISRYGAAVQSLLAADVAVVGGLGLWLAEADLTKVLLITGTKGKSTSVAVAGHLLTRLGYRALVAGNIGQPPYDPDIGGDYDYWVVEVSSYQATDLARTPPVAAVTSLHPDHLPWHGGEPETYFRDKLSALSQPGADVTVANGDSQLLRERATLLGPQVRWVSASDDPGATWMQGLGLLGEHNRRNALIVRECLRAMGIVEAGNDVAMSRAAQGFSGLASRLSVVGHAGGVMFVDDNLSTNVLPTLAAVQAFGDRRVALILGGQSRGIDYAPLGIGLRQRELPLLLVTVPTNGPDIHAQVAAADPGPAVSMLDADSLDAAVRASTGWADPDGVVLLSPAAPSFDLFRDYRARGEAFVAAMRACGGIPVTAG